MIYSLLVLSSPVTGQGAQTAAAFAQAVLAAGHTIKRVFFFDAGCYTGSNLAVFPQDEADRLEPWVALQETQQVELVLCISSAIRRGQLDTTEASRHEKTGPSIHPAFTLSGLGELVDATVHSDRLVTFGG